MIFNRHTVPNAVRALLRILRQLFLRPESVIVAPDLADTRTILCETCPSFEPASRQCRECTCFVDVKVLLSTEKCPIQRW